MATEKRLIDANALVIEELLVMDRDYINEFASGVRKVMNAIRRLPVVDAVEVVRCEDCKYRTYDGYHKHHYCSNTRGCRYVILPDHFCSYGERKTDG